MDITKKKKKNVHRRVTTLTLAYFDHESTPATPDFPPSLDKRVSVENYRSTFKTTEKITEVDTSELLFFL